MDLIECIRLQKCPYCDDKRTFSCLAAHTSQVHGVTGYELREQAGLNRSTSICSLEHAQTMRDKVLSRDQEVLVDQLTCGRSKKVWSGRDATWRPEARAKHMADRKRPARMAAFVASMRAVDGQRSEKAKNRSPDVVAEQTARVQLAHKKWLERATPEEVAESRKRAYQTWIKNTSQEYVDEHMSSMRKMIPHEAHLKAAAAGHRALPSYHADPQWKAAWRAKLLAAIRKRAKVPHTDFPQIRARVANGETPKAVATGYGVTASYIRKLCREEA